MTLKKGVIKDSVVGAAADEGLLLDFGEVGWDDVALEVSEGFLIPRGVRTNKDTYHFRLKDVIRWDKELLHQELALLTFS